MPASALRLVDAHSSRPRTLTADEAHVLALLTDPENHSYEAIQAMTGWSRGRIYRLAVRCGARKTEARIRERAADRKRRQREFLEQVINSTQTADCLDWFDGMPDNAAQLVVTSVPYNVGVAYGDGASADSMPFLYYLGWLFQVISEAARALKPGGTLFLQVGWTRDHQDWLVPLDVLLFEPCRQAGLTFQNRVVWRIPHGLTPAKRLAGRHETALVFTKGDVAVFNANAARIPQLNPGKRAYKGPNRGRLSGHPFGAAPTDVWEIPTVRHNNPEKTDHPAQFPLGLAMRAILLYTNAGDLVLDPFSGSGTTQEGAVRTGRAFAGCDLFYEDVRHARLAGVTLDAATRLPGITDESAALWQAEVARDGRAPVYADASEGAAPAVPVWQARAEPVTHPATPIAEAEELQLLFTLTAAPDDEA